MKTASYARNRLIQVVMFVAIVASVGYVGKLIYEAIDATKDIVETVQETATEMSRTETAEAVHGNSHKNNNLHIVYEIYGVDAWGAKFVLKYGITSQNNYKTKWGNPRPKLQLKTHRQKPEFKRFKSIDYNILDSMIIGRKLAKAIEQEYVNIHYLEHGYSPLAQQLPIPEEEIFDRPDF